jgi:hypothetical protein
MKNLIEKKVTSRVVRVNRGITLLLVLALMTIFSMLVITFMIVTTAAKNAAISQARFLTDPKDRDDDSLRKERDKAITNILVGDPNNSIGALSILENLYGNRASHGVVDNFTAISNNLRRVDCSSITSASFPLGHVFTITGFDNNSPLDSFQMSIVDRYKNRSVLIKEVGSGYVDIEKFSNNDTTEINDLISKGKWRFIINSPAFSGTGEGVNPASNVPHLSATDTTLDGLTLPRVFLPNLSGYGKLANVMMNPDYTAPDHLTWFLAWYDIDNAGAIINNNIVPSFHRPQIISYLNDLGVDASTPNALKAATLRPLPTEHTHFTGSNPDATIPAGSSTADTTAKLIAFLTHDGTEWDVDNDNDGIKDSIWIDPDLPSFEDRSRSQSKPKRVKPLIAVMIRDLDGLINVNAHGNQSSSAVSSLASTAGAYTLSGANGSGMGPAEVRLNLGTVANGILGARNISSSGSDVPASVDSDSYAGSHAGSTGRGRLYPDFWGVAPITFEPMGYRFFDLANLPNLYNNNPYMTNVYASKGNPFEVTELEIFLRSQFDADSNQFAHGLRDIFNSDFAANRYLITTHSSNIPATSLYGGVLGTANYANLFARIRAMVNNNTTNFDAIVNNLPPEIKRGEKINLNKVTNMTLAEKSEFAHQIFLMLMILCNDRINGYTESGFGLNPGVPANIPVLRRGIVSRLAQWSVNLVDFIDADATMTPMFFSLDPFRYTNYLGVPNGPYLTYFNDKIITGNTDGTWTNSQMQIVFGKEDNDLFITKTFATHNRNTADSKRNNTTTCTETGCTYAKGYVKSDCSGGHDQSFDQIFKPEGSLFIELYRAGDPTRWRTTGELYNSDNSLNLARVNSQGEPVWRIAISDEMNATSRFPSDLRTQGWQYDFQPPQWYPTSSPTPILKPERFIFFVDDLINPADGTSMTHITNGNTDLRKRSFFNKGTVVESSPGSSNRRVYHTADTVLNPNNFFLIAPRVLTSFKSVEVDESTANPFGVPDGSPGTQIDLGSFVGNTRVKTMVAAIDASELEDSDSDRDWDAVSGINILALGFRTNSDGFDPTYRGIGVNISEPLPTSENMTETNGYYPIPTFADNKDSYTTSGNDFNNPQYSLTKYTVADPSGTAFDFANGFGTIPAFKSIFLQRLADPTRQHHPQNNPYITVDWSLVDLHVFTSERVSNTAHTTGEFDTPATISLSPRLNNSLYFNIREWGTTAARADIASKRPNIRDRSFTTNIEQASALGNAMTDNYVPPQLPATADADTNPQWGRLSHNYYDDTDNGDEHGTTIAGWNNSLHPGVDFTGVPERGFVHFPWNDSPLSSTFELMLVPATSPARFGYECYDTEANPTYKIAGSLGMDGGSRFKNPETQTGPYLNFFASGLDASGVPVLNSTLDLVRLFEYVQVPSRFINTKEPQQAMREPGKININTMTQKSWEALGGDAVTYGTIRSRFSDPLPRPFRSPHAANSVPDTSMAQVPVDTTLLGAFPPGTATTGDNLYTSLHHLLRLSEMTTTRSNVFAVWVTTGYFEIESNGTLGKEIGYDDGTIERHRDFYIIDRSIPVGFIRGEKLNTNRVIIHKKSLE